MRATDRLTAPQCRQLLGRGYVLLRQAVPRELVERAKATIEADLTRDRSLGRNLDFSSTSFCPTLRDGAEVTALFRDGKLQAIVEDAFAPDGADRSQAQIAVRFPEHRDRPSVEELHVDGFPSARNGVYAGGIHRQTALCGIYLNRLDRPYMGNLAVWPGSHRHFERLFRRIDPARMLARRGAAAVHRRLQAESLGEPEHLRVEPGDAVLAHGALAHAAAANLSLQPRLAVYFRIHHRADDPGDPSPLADAFRFFERVVARAHVGSPP